VPVDHTLNDPTRGGTGETLPSRGDRIELAERGFGLPLRGTVHYVDRVQILVKLDDGRSRSLRIGIDAFRLLSGDDHPERG
jgi:hypothetical protein